MASRIKGITIEIGGNATQLTEALKGVDGQLSNTQTKLKDVNRLLKFNPANVTLLAQKQSALKQAIEQSKQRADQLRSALAQMRASGAAEEEIEALERELIQTESKTKALEKELKNLGNPKLTALSTQLKNIGGSISNAGGKIKDMGAKFMPVTTAIGGVTAAAGALAMKAASTGDRIDKMSQKVGLSRKSFQEMEFIMSQSGGKIESMQTGMKTLTKQMSGAATGSKTSSAAFQQLGVSVTNADGSLRNQEDVMWDTIKALQGMDNQTQKARIASQLFGKAGTELMPLLNSEAGSLDKMRKKANDLGLVMSDDAVDASVKFTDTLDQLKRSLMAAGAKIGAALLPHIQKFAQYLVKNMPKIQATIQGVVTKITSISPTVMKVIGVAALVAAAIGPVLVTIGSMVVAIGGLVTAIGWLFSPIGLFVAGITAAIAATVLMVKNWKKLEAAAKTLWKNLKTSFGQIKTAILTAWNAIKSGISKAWTAIRTVVTNGVNAVKSKISTVFNAVKSFVGTVWNGIKTTIGNAVKAVKTTVSTVFNAVKTTVSNAVNAIKSKVSSVFKAVKTTVTSIWGGIKTTISNAINGAKTTVSNAVSKIKGFLNFKGVKSAVQGIFNTVKSYIKTPINAAKDAVSEAVDKVKSFLNFKGLKTTVSGLFKGIGSSISKPINTAKDTISKIVDKIKGFFDKLELKIPKPKLPSLPKISLTMDEKTVFGKTFKYPTGFKISWNRDAMDLGRIINGASIIGADANGNLIGAGEAGQEVVVGKKSLLTMVRQASASGSAGMERRLANIEKLLGRYLQADTKIVLDTGVVAGAVNRNLGVRW